MPSNVEIKANVKDLGMVKRIAAELSQTDGTLIVQEDTFFHASNGRLKLRQLQVSGKVLASRASGHHIITQTLENNRSGHPKEF